MSVLKPLIVAVALTGVVAANANLIVNGSFETGDTTGWNLTGVDTSFDAVVAFANTGDYGFEFGASAPFDTLSQSIDTIAGANYTLDFYFANYDSGPNELQVSVGGNQLAEYVDFSIGDYTKQELFFIGTGASEDVAFSAYDGFAFIYLDDVSLTTDAPNPVPEPATLGLLALAAPAMLRRRRK